MLSAWLIRVFGRNLSSSLVLFWGGKNIKVELIHSLVLFRNNCVLWLGPFLMGVLCHGLVLFWGGKNIKVELIHSLVLFRNNCVLWLGPFLMGVLCHGLVLF